MSAQEGTNFRSPGPALRRSLFAGTTLASVALIGSQTLAGNPAPAALPSGGQVVSGQATIARAAGAMTVTQTSAKAILAWQGFDIGPQASVTFRQPDATSMILNRVTAGAASRIEGQLSANGQVILVNPNGVVFGSGATVNAGGLVASTLDIKDADFMAGTMVFQRNGTPGAVVNHGTISAGYGVLLGPQLTNDGLIEARLSTVALASGEAVVLSFSGDTLVGVALSPSTVATLIDAGGIIRADNGGRVLVSASAANALLGGAINATGVIEADSLTGKGGKVSLAASGPIRLTGAKVTATGATGGGGITLGNAGTASVTVDAASRLDASATGRGDGGTVRVDSDATAFHGRAAAKGGPQGGDGGQVETSGDSLDIAGALVDVGSFLGRVGTWLLDPVDFVIDGSNIGAILTGLAGGDVTIQTTGSGDTVTGATAPDGARPGANGDIVVSAPVKWTGTAGSNLLTLDSGHGVQINAPISATGSSAGLVIQTNDSGGSGGSLSFGGGAVTLAGSATLTIQGQSYTLISSAGDLRSLAGAGTYALAGDIDLGLTAFTPLSFSGTLEGLGHSITGLSVTGTSSLGLFSAIGAGGAVRDFTLAGTVSAGQGGTNIGMLAGINRGTISNIGTSGTVAAGNSSSFVGGMVGTNYGAIAQSYALGMVSAGNGVNSLGGLAGQNTDVSALISQSFANTRVIAGNGSNFVGGLVGQSNNDLNIPGIAPSDYAGNKAEQGGSITQCYAAGSVSAGSGAQFLGGLAGGIGGFDIFGDTYPAAVAQSYSTAAVVAGAKSFAVGGLAGSATGIVTQTYSSGAVSVGPGNSYVGGLFGLFVSAENTEAVTNGFTNFLSPPSVASGNFWDPGTSTQTVGVGASVGSPGASAAARAAAFAQSTYAAAGWSFTGTVGGSGVWAMVDGYTRPLLAWEHSTAIINPHQLQLVSLDPTASYRLGGNIDLGAAANPSDVWNPTTGFVPIGFSGTGNNASPTAFSGSFDGQGHGIAGLTIADGGSGNLGLFSAIGSGGSVQSLLLSGGAVTAGANATNIGMLAGRNDGTITNVAATGSVSGGDRAQSLGGLVGSNTGTIAQSYADGPVAGGLAAAGIGGLVGANAGGTIVQCYAIGPVSAGSGAQNLGGLVGVNSGAVSSSYWDLSLSEQTSSAGGTGLATADWPGQGPAADTVWTTSGAWTLISGHPYPLLSAFPYVTVAIAPAIGAPITYGQAVPAFSAGLVAASDGSGAGSAAGLVVGPPNGTRLPAGDDSIGVTGIVAPGYQIDFVPAQLTVAPLPVTVSGSRAYDGGNSADGSILRVGNLVAGDGAALTLSGNATLSGSGAGTQTISGWGGLALSGAGAGNYTLTGASGGVTILPKGVTWSVADSAATYGTPATPGAATLTGVIAGDTVSAMVGVFSGATAVNPAATTPAGNYAEQVTALAGASAGNYTLAGSSNGSGTLTIAPLPVTVGGSRVYDGGKSADGTILRVGNLVTGDGAALTFSGSATLSGSGAGTQSISGWGGLALSGAGAGNYTLTGASGGVTILPKGLTWSVADSTATYGTTATPGAATLTGVIAGDTVSAMVGVFSGATAVNPATTTPAGNYAEQVTALAGMSAGNYTLAGSPNGSGTLTIAPLPVTVSGSRVYDGGKSADGTILRVGNLVTGDGAALTFSGSATLSGSGAGTQSISGWGGLALSGAGAGNYTLTGASGGVTILPKGLTWSVADSTATYGTTATPGAATLTGVIAGDTVSAMVGVFSGATAVNLTATTPVGNYSEQVTALAGPSAGNYSLASSGNNPGRLTVVAVPTPSAQPVIPVGVSGVDNPGAQAIFASLGTNFEEQISVLPAARRDPVEMAEPPPMADAYSQCASGDGQSQVCLPVPASLVKVLGLAGKVGWLAHFNDASVATASRGSD